MLIQLIRKQPIKYCSLLTKSSFVFSWLILLFLHYKNCYWRKLTVLFMFLPLCTTRLARGMLFKTVFTKYRHFYKSSVYLVDTSIRQKLTLRCLCCLCIGLNVQILEILYGSVIYCYGSQRLSINDYLDFSPFNCFFTIGFYKTIKVRKNKKVCK